MIRLCAPAFDDADRQRVAAVLDSGMLVQGEMVRRFEAGLSAFLGVPARACANGTAALHIALQAVGVGAGDEVIVPAFTWPSAANVVVQTGATPVFVDIDPDTLNLQADAIERLVTERTRAIVPIHQFGIPAPMGSVMAVARAHGLRVVEDAACAIGTRCGDAGSGDAAADRLAGTVGDLGCFSFHPRKVITTGEGGAVVGSDADLIARVDSLRNHGQGPAGGLERFDDAGLNYRMPELGAAIGIGQVEQLESIVATRRRLAARYVRELAAVPGVRVPPGVADPRGNHQSFVIDVLRADRRDAFMNGCAAGGVQTTIGTYAVVSQPVYRRLGVDPRRFPHAVAASHRLVTLPLHHGMTEADVEHVVSVVDATSRSL